MKAILFLALTITSMSVFANSDIVCPARPPGPASVHAQKQKAEHYVSNGIAVVYGNTAGDALRELSKAIEYSKNSEFVINYIVAVKKPLTLSAVTVTEEDDGHGCKTYYASVSVNSNN